LAKPSSPAQLRAARHLRDDLVKFDFSHAPRLHSFSDSTMGEYPINALAVSLFGVVMAVKNSR